MSVLNQVETSAQPNVYTRNHQDGSYGLFACKEFQHGETILNIRLGDKVKDCHKRSIELDDGHYMHPDGIFTNHSCDPSAIVDKKSGLLVAARHINPDDEITYDYLQTESSLTGCFQCYCGAEDCVGLVEKS